MKNIPTLFKGDDISVKLTYGSDNTELSDVIIDGFGTNIVITEVTGKILINNIPFGNLPVVDVSEEELLFELSRTETKQYEKGLLEVELLLSLNYSGAIKKIAKKVAIAWVKDAHTASL